MIARKHCAGRCGTVTGAGILAAIAAPPDPESDASGVVSWMLSSVRPHECAILFTCCGVTCEDLARHARACSSAPRSCASSTSSPSTDRA